MDIFTQIVGGLTLVALGTASLKYNFQLVEFVGHVGAFERYLGAGGTYFGFKLLSIITILGGFFYATGLLGPVAGFLLSPLLNIMGQNESGL